MSGAGRNRRPDGEIRMRFAKRGDRTAALDTYRSGNSRISANIPTAGDIPVHFLISTGGGFTEGETYRQDIVLEEGAHAILTSQTPSYIYKCDAGRLTTQDNELTVGAGATLEYYMDEVIPYANARFLQSTQVHMAPGARLILIDGLTAGWSEDGAPFQYKDVGLKNRIFRGDELLLNDFLLLDPTEENVNALGYMEGATHYNSAIIIDEAADESMLEQMRKTLAEAVESLTMTNGSKEGSKDRKVSMRYGLTLLARGGIALRVLGPDLEENRFVVRSWIDAYREHTLGLPHLRLRKTPAY
jgi:urease accessory protein